MNVKLLQWNIWFKEKIENVAKLIKEIDPDIVCLQELTIDCDFNTNVYDTAKYLSDKLGFYYFFKEGQTWDKKSNKLDRKAQGNGIFSRYPIVKKFSHFIQKPTPNTTDYTKEGRIYLEMDLKINNETITIATTHVSYSHRFEITDWKKIEVDNLVNALKTKKEKFIFSGDLNSTPESYTIYEIIKYLKNFGPDYNEKTWTTKIFKEGDFKEDKLNWRLDYIFGTEDIKIKSAKIMNTNYSDHLPILLEFSFW